jgi:hypothetical protein
MHRTLEHVITLARIPATRLSSVAIARISITTGAVIAGSATTATKSAIAEISPLTLAFCRFGVATLVLLVLCRIASRSLPLVGWTQVSRIDRGRGIGNRNAGQATLHQPNHNLISARPAEI